MLQLFVMSMPAAESVAQVNAAEPPTYEGRPGNGDVGQTPAPTVWWLA